MPEEQAFCVLVKMMFDYGLRDLFKQGFEELHLRFYQLERLMQVKYKREKAQDWFWNGLIKPNWSYVTLFHIC